MATVLIKEGSGDIAYELYGANGASRPEGYVKVGSRIGIHATAELAVNTWTHLAGTYDGTTVRMFMNGVQIASIAESGPIDTFDRGAANRRQQHMERALPGPARRDSHLQPRAHAGRNPDRHEFADWRCAAGYDGTGALKRVAVGTLAAGTTQTTLSLTTNESATCQLHHNSGDGIRVR